MLIKFTWFGTANYILELDGIRLLFDPFFQRNQLSKPVLKTQREDIDSIKAIFISHGHFDHMTEAGWFAENQDVPVYCSNTAKENIIKWTNGEIIEDQSHPLSERAVANIKSCNFNDIIDISSEISVEIIKSEHIKFDAESITSRLFSWKFLKKIRSMAKIGGSLPAGSVFGFCIKYKDKRIITFGSLWHEYEDILSNYKGCDILIAPLAGNSKKHLAQKTGKIVDILNPSIIIPVHWDDFYPPISRFEDLNPFYKLMDENHPDVQILMPKIDEEIAINLD